jgi:molybdopterin molybdotransferase
MEIEIQLTHEPIAEKISPPVVARASRPFDERLKLTGETPAPLPLGAHGAWLEFRGVVRGEEDGQTIRALEYQAYPEMAGREIRRLLQEISARHPCLAAKVIHRIGVIPVGETAIYVGVVSPHRGEAIALLAEFMDRLKQDVPIWKRRAIADGADSARRVTPCAPIEVRLPTSGGQGTARPTLKSLDEARAEICTHCRPLPAVRAPLAEAFGRVLRETVCAPEDLPSVDRATRDGYAICADDVSKTFSVVDTIHAADWKPRQLKPGETVRVATGAALPCSGLRVVMQEHVERDGDKLHVVRLDNSTNVRLRGEEVRQGQPLVPAGIKLNAGALAILAMVGNVNPLVSPRLRILHLTTGDEIVPPDQTPKPGQIRDSNSILIRGLVQHFPCELLHAHLPEDFEKAKHSVSAFSLQPSAFDLLLVSGGASVGEKDFTRPFLEWLGFDIVFNQVNLRPGRPLIFGVNGARVAFGLPGNPLSHFVCYHLFVALALARLVGVDSPAFLRGQLAARLNDESNPRETLWPAKWHGRPARELQAKEAGGGNWKLAGETPAPLLIPLKWSSSGDVTCLAETNALVRVPANTSRLEQFAEVDFLPVTAMLGGGW